MADIEKVHKIEADAFGGDYDNDAEHQDAADAEAYTTAIVQLTDDPSTPAFTFRMVFLGCFFAFGLAFANTVFSFRNNPPTVPSSVATLLSYPMGVFMATVLPRGILNPGPFSIKEHVLIAILASSAGGQAYGLDNVVGQHFFLGQDGATFWPSLLFILSTQLIGYGLAGITRRFLIKPAAMLWPANLAQIALFRAFHDKPEDEDEKLKQVGGLSRYGFFWLVLSFTFVYELIPQYFAQGLQIVSLLCFFSSSQLATILGSGYYGEGVGVLALSFDWNIISQFALPLTTPYWATLNYTASVVFWVWIVVPLMQFTNPFGIPFLQGGALYRDNSTVMPVINSASLFSKDGIPVPSTRILNINTLSLNTTAYDKVAPIYISNYFALLYLTSFMNIASVLSHVGLWYGKDIWRQCKEALAQVDSDDDIHNQLMKAYPDIPEWMYIAYTAILLVAQIFILQFTVYKMPWWATLIAFLIGLVFIIPIGAIQALTNQQIGLNVITEFLAGLMMPGDFVAVTTFKSFGYNIMIQALNLSADLKLGHYMHIPPIAMVAAQFIGTVIGAVLNTAIGFWMMDNLFPVLKVQDPVNWTAAYYRIFLSAGSIWGAIGPVRFFGIGSVYQNLLWGFPVGFFAPFLPWLANKVYPSRNWHFVNFPVFLSLGNYITATQSFVVMPLILATVFQYYMFNYRHAWWTKYNYTLSVGLDTGTAFAILLATFLTYGKVVPGAFQLNPSTSPDYYCFLADGP